MRQKAPLIIFVSLLILLFLGSFFLGHYIRKNVFGEIENQAGRTNFLLLGINGLGESGSDLTDTMIFASLNSKNQKAVMLSLPRDIWVREIQAKINTAYHYGGFDLTKKIIEEILGQKVNYVLVLDFNGFEKAIDLLGGIEVEVSRSFDDYKYPLPGKEKDLCGGDKELKCRYEHIHFEAGRQLMDGQTALKFVRSRNAEGEEGTDFARSLRQQKLIEGFRRKLGSADFYLHPAKVFRLWQVFQNSVKTDISRRQYGDFLLLAARVDLKRIKAGTIDDFVTHPKTHYSKQWVLVPKAGNWQEVQEFVEGLLR